MEKIQDDIASILEDISCFVPLSLSFWAIKRGGKMIKKMIYEERIGDLDKKDLLSYLIGDRLLIEKLPNNEIRDYYKYFKKIYKMRKFNNIKNSIHCFLFRKKKESL